MKNKKAKAAYRKLKREYEELYSDYIDLQEKSGRERYHYDSVSSLLFNAIGDIFHALDPLISVLPPQLYKEIEGSLLSRLGCVADQLVKKTTCDSLSDDRSEKLGRLIYEKIGKYHERRLELFQENDFLDPGKKRLYNVTLMSMLGCSMNAVKPSKARYDHYVRWFSDHCSFKHHIEDWVWKELEEMGKMPEYVG